MKKVSRFWARVCIVCLVISLLLITCKIITSSNVPLFIGTLFLVFSLYIKFFILRCPNCNWGGGVPQWSKNATIHCPKCGTAFEYDE